MFPLAHAVFGWVFVIFVVQPVGGALDVGVDAVGWLGIAWGWHQLVAVEPSFATARTAALVGAATAATRLLPGPEVLLVAAQLVAVAVVALALSLGAAALMRAAEEHGSALVAAQCSFLRWAAVGVLVIEGGAALSSLAVPQLTGLATSAVLMGLGLAGYFTVLQLASVGRSYLRVGGRR
ncbi:hypothetical protein BH20ACT6_BH20ACT6_20460 [soil metagenome]